MRMGAKEKEIKEEVEGIPQCFGQQSRWFSVIVLLQLIVRS